MAFPDYKKFLAENVLSERRTVTYRSLGRALKVHSTVAKQMLYDFHHHENSKNPNSVNATYILTGTPKSLSLSPTNGADPGNKLNEENGIMPSSPYLPSSMPNQDIATDQFPITAVVLAREEDMEDAKSTFEFISTIYIYSLQPTNLQDLNVLTDVAREMLSNHVQDDPLEHGKQWGMIQNKNVKRRTGARPPPPPPPPPPTKSTIPAKRPAQSEHKAEAKDESAQSSKLSWPQGATAASAKAAEKAAPIKKEKNNLFSSFAKAKPKQKKEDTSTPAASGAESAEPSGPEDVVLDDASEEEPEDLFPESRKQAASESRESRKEREEKLKKMMEDSDDADGEGIDGEDEDEDEDEEMRDVAEMAEDPNVLIDQPPPKQEETKVEITVQGGRRRGRRQVMKKKTMKDDEGYLVTVEEPTWESFSEDEPAPPPQKKKPAVSAPKAKAGAKAGQGNIMSFFSKK